MALVTRGRGVPRADDVLGVITKEHVADFGRQQHRGLSGRQLIGAAVARPGPDEQTRAEPYSS